MYENHIVDHTNTGNDRTPAILSSGRWLVYDSLYAYRGRLDAHDTPHSEDGISFPIVNFNVEKLIYKIGGYTHLFKYDSNII